MKGLNIIALFALILASFTAVFAQDDQETREVSAFSKIDAGGIVNVFLKKGSKESVRIEVTDFDLENVIVEVRGSTLEIDTEKERGKWGRGRESRVDVFVTYKTLESIEVSGASDLKAEDDVIETNTLKLHASGASDMILKVNVQNLIVDTSGASDIRISGTAKSQDVEVSGSSDFKAYQLNSEEAHVVATGASDAQISVSKTLEARASGSSDVNYKGNPTRVIVKASGASDITRKN